MLTEVKKLEVKELYPVPKRDSHKGQNGKIMIVGGSLDYYGAPILSAMGALFGGADLVTLYVPECNFTISRTYYPDFIVKKFTGDYLDARSVELISMATAKQKCLVIGPGIGERKETMAAVNAIIKKSKCPVVLDAQAIYALPTKNVRENSNILITPHAQELSNLCSHGVPSLLIEKVETVKKCAKDMNVNILLKNPIDIIASPKGEFCINQAGNPGLTSGGTGDVLSGFVGSLTSRGLRLYDAARLGAFIICTAGDELLHEKGHAFTATDLALHLPYTIKRLLA
ncbi:MAG: NAD(P)H-hydrate dehydratase [Candidatus Peregrinibacteria bacterium]|nr:NAD(P)H-hydrate dehydratase [Candidatus Peregrinibacteria bacterium]